MDEWRRLCSHPHTEGRIISRLDETGVTSYMKEAVLNEIISPSVDISNLEEEIYRVVNSSGLHIHLKNSVYKELLCLSDEGVNNSSHIPLADRKEPVDFIRIAQKKWENKIILAINKLCTDYDITLSKQRQAKEKEILRKRWNSLGADYPELRLDFHPIFGPKDFQGIVMRVHDPTYTPYPHPLDPGAPDPAGGALHANINVASLYRLRKQFKSLHPSQLQIESGAYHLNYRRTVSNLGSVQYIEKSNKVLKNGLWSLAREMCKTGCVVGHRRELWCRTLALDTSQPEHAFRYEELKSAVLNYSLMFEKLMDVKKTAANDDNYFVFEDLMHQTLLCFLHDSSLIQQFEHLCPTPLSAYYKGEEEPERKIIYPPNGVIPFHGFSLYIAPLCFLFNRADHLYATFREMYSKYFIHLHSVSSHPQGILSLCCQFESLLQCKEPELFKHLKDIDVQPLRLAFGWLMSAFSGYLDSRELLLLWDRVIGHTSLTITAVMAVAIFKLRAANLFKATTNSEAEDILSDLRCIKVLPLLQQTLFL